MLKLTTKKVAVIGYAPNVRHAPWNDPSYTIVGLNDQPFTMPRIDVLFELHSPEVIKEEGHWDRLKALTIPIFMQERYEEIPTSVKYPLALVNSRYTVEGCDRAYLTCSASEMLAVVVNADPRPERIDVFGVDMAQDSEFAHQRPSCEFWLGVAHGMGIAISVQHSSDLLKCRWIYGFENEKIDVFTHQMRERQQFLEGMHNAAMQKEAAAKEERLQYVGALADISHIRQRYGV